METAEMLNDPVSKEINYAQKGFCLQEGPLTVPSAEDTGEEDTEEEDTVSGERGGDGIVSFYIEQLRAIPPLSAEAEKALCKSIKAGEKVIETLIGHWCYLFEVFLNLPEEVLVATVNSCNNSPINYHYTDGVRKNGLHETVLLFEKINALKREHKRSWSALRSSTTKPTCDELHTGAEKITAEISKLISHLTINEQETHMCMTHRLLIDLLETDSRLRGRSPLPSLCLVTHCTFRSSNVCLSLPSLQDACTCFQVEWHGFCFCFLVCL